MDILVAVQNRDIRDVLTFTLENQLKLRVLSAKSSGEALDLILKDESLNIIVLEHPALSGPVIKYLNATQRTAQIFLVGDPSTPKATWQEDLAKIKPIGSTQDSDWVQGIVPQISTFLESLVAVPGANGTLSDPEVDEPYAKIRPHLLLMASPLKGDVFVKLSGNKFLKLFAAGSEFDQNDYKKYVVEKNLEYLYLKKEDAENFVARLQNKIASQIDAGAMDESNATDTAVSLHQTVRELITKIEPTEVLSPLIKEHARLTLRAVGKNPKLKGIIGKLALDPKSYISTHSIALSQLCCGLAIAMDWGSETTFHKLNLAAFMHDITLENQTLARIHSMDELMANKSKFTAKEIAEYPLHPMRAAEIARKFSEIPPDVDTLILQHHEFPDGSGFPRKLNAKQITPLSALFIVAHELIHVISEQGPNFQMAHFLDENLERYSAGHFKKVLACLLKAKS